MEDVTNGREVYAKPPCEFPSRQVLAEGADLSHSILRQLGVLVLTAARVIWVNQSALKRVLYVLGRAHLLKVTQSVVGLDAVDVIGLLAGGEGTSEGGKDEAVNVKATGTAPTEAYMEIAGAPQVCFENPARPGTTGSPHTPHPSEVGDLIETFVADDGEPSFLGQGELCRLRVHRKGLLSLPCGRTANTVAATTII